MTALAQANNLTTFSEGLYNVSILNSWKLVSKINQPYLFFFLVVLFPWEWVWHKEEAQMAVNSQQKHSIAFQLVTGALTSNLNMSTWIDVTTMVSFATVWVWISADTPAILTEMTRGFHGCHQENCGTVLQLRHDLCLQILSSYWSVVSYRYWRKFVPVLN
jgi:hypothetical protein